MTYLNQFRAKLVSIIILVIILHSHNIAAIELTASQIAKKYSLSVVTIVALDENDQPLSLGSGFFINKEGAIATNYHVLEGSVRAIIKTVSGKKGQITEIIKADQELDLLIAKTSILNINPVPLGDSDAITVGEDVVAIGNPAGLEGTISKGIISGVRNVEGVSFIQITSPISPGSSGGPVFNVKGKVIGIATAYLDRGQNLNFAMPVNYLRSLKTIRVKLSSLPKGKSLKRHKKDIVDTSILKIVNVIKGSYTMSPRGDYVNGIRFSVQNNSNYLIKNIKILVLFHNKNKELFSYAYSLIKNEIPPRLAETVYIHKELYGYYDGGYAKFRILDFDILSKSDSALDYLLKK